MRSAVTIRVKGAEEAAGKLRAYELRKRGALGKAVALTLLQGEGRMRRMLSQPGRGRTYTRGSVTHRASAPGDPPATDTGVYKTSWRRRTTALGSATPGGDLYTEQERGPWLEYGTARMAARPHAGPVAEQMADDFRGHVVTAMRGL